MLVLPSEPAKTCGMAEETSGADLFAMEKPRPLHSVRPVLLAHRADLHRAVRAISRRKIKSIELTTERLKITEGVFSKVTDTLELYRVKDIEMRQPFLYRMFHVENISVTTSDTSSPLVFLEAIPSAVSFADKIRNRVEAVRMEKRVHEIDIE